MVARVAEQIRAAHRRPEILLRHEGQDLDRFGQAERVAPAHVGRRRGAGADHGDLERQPAFQQAQGLDQDVLPLLAGRKPRRHQQAQTRLRTWPGPAQRHRARVHADIGDEARAGGEAQPGLGRLPLDQIARAPGEIVDGIDRVEDPGIIRGERGPVPAGGRLEDRIVPAHSGHAHDDCHPGCHPGCYPGRLGVAAGQRLGEELHLVEGIEQIDVSVREDPRAHPRPGPRIERRSQPVQSQPAQPQLPRRPAQAALDARAQRSPRAGAEQDGDAVHREALGEGQGIRAQRCEGHGMAPRGQALGDQAHGVFRAADPVAQVGRLFGKKQDVHQDLDSEMAKAHTRLVHALHTPCTRPRRAHGPRLTRRRVAYRTGSGCLCRRGILAIFRAGCKNKRH